MKDLIALLQSHRYLATTLTCVLAIFVLNRLYFAEEYTSSGHSDYLPPTNPPGHQLHNDGHRVHLLIPANRADYRLCRTLASTLVNRYPSPTLINWEQQPGDASMNGYDMTTGKNWGVLQFLRSLPSEADQDLVIMVDAYDVIFQLPLDVVLQRYEAINKQATDRLIRQHGEEQVLRYGLNQTIIMGAEKYCWPLNHKHPACWAVPASPLPPDVYGSRTDRGNGEKSRPRWLNSGTIMGPVGDLRKLYEHAHMLWTAYDTDGGDQDYFSNIYGRQELSRQQLRGSKEWIFGFGKTYKEKSLIWPHMETQHVDYHLGVDLSSSLFQMMNGAIGDVSSVVHSASAEVEAKDRQHRTAGVYGAPFPFPDDLLQSRIPNGGQINGQPDITWRDVSLFTNFYARCIPAVLHYNGDVKSSVDKSWRAQWWQGRGREMVRLRTSEPRFRINTDANRTLQWNEICGTFENRLLRNS
ncbi:hypothetical protein QQS21_010213 [Conoideocrella luteorostrata]|uniref:Uncharacterized protein n=1 Tax=Conoideocrella luteorostrata TaxID=1105319 RepID=A0AAJ0FPL8_9HYPO|nr:hypothetical protein QQS21_010213 [Conoideocrella luteorostrata]